MSRDVIKKLIAEELEKANKKFRKFNSCHEAYGVLKEEIEELLIEVKNIQYFLEKYWERCKNSKDITYNDIFIMLEEFNNVGYKALLELIQVNAMIRKTHEYEDRLEAPTIRIWCGINENYTDELKECNIHKKTFEEGECEFCPNGDRREEDN